MHVHTQSTRSEGSTKVLQWYTKECFFYKTLNSALRKENIHWIFLYRSFIFDLYERLKTYKSNEILRVYRTQIISKDELKSLKDSINQFISTNSFFSTTLNYSKAISFLNRSKSTENTEKILFQIEANPNIVKTKPFTNISRFSEYPKEDEVLFMIGSIFQLKNISFDHDKQCSIIEMTLSSDEDNQLKHILIHMKEQIGDGQINLRILAKILSERGEFELAEKYLKRFIEQLSPNDSILADLYADLAIITLQTHRSDESMIWKQKLIDFKAQNPTETISKYIKLKNCFLLTKISSTLIDSIVLDNENTQVNINHNIQQPNNWLATDIDATLTDFKRVFILWFQYIIQILYRNGHRSFVIIIGIIIMISMYSKHNITNYQNRIFSQPSSKFKLKWKQNAVTIVGGDQLYQPCGIAIDNNQQYMYIADTGHNRIVRLKFNSTDIAVIPVENKQQIIMESLINLWNRYIDQIVRSIKMLSQGNMNEQLNLNKPTDVILDRTGKSLIICDQGNRRVVRWSIYDYRDREIIFLNIDCVGLVMNDNGYLFVSDWKKNKVIKWRKGEEEKTVVAGDNGRGAELNQLNHPTYIVVDQQETIYVSDSKNNRVMKWIKGAKQGVVVAGGHGCGSSTKQLSAPYGLVVNQAGDVFVADSSNNRIMHWSPESKEGLIVVGGNDQKLNSNQLNYPLDLYFDHQNNLYITDRGNNRIQRFDFVRN